MLSVFKDLQLAFKELGLGKRCRLALFEQCSSSLPTDAYSRDLKMRFFRTVI
jgi:hypothetical protein